MEIQQPDYRGRKHNCSHCFITVKISVTNFERHEEGELCRSVFVHKRACVIGLGRGAGCESSRRFCGDV